MLFLIHHVPDHSSILTTVEPILSDIASELQTDQRALVVMADNEEEALRLGRRLADIRVMLAALGERRRVVLANATFRKGYDAALDDLAAFVDTSRAPPPEPDSTGALALIDSGRAEVLILIRSWIDSHRPTDLPPRAEAAE